MSSTANSNPLCGEILLLDVQPIVLTVDQVNGSHAFLSVFLFLFEAALLLAVRLARTMVTTTMGIYTNAT